MESSTTNKIVAITAIFTAFFAAGSFLISIRSCSTSNEAKRISEASNKLAEEANEISNDVLDSIKEQFVKINRPRLRIRAIKFDDEKYWQLSRDGNELTMNLKYEIKNVGTAAAVNVTIPEKTVEAQISPIPRSDKVNFTKQGEDIDLDVDDDFKYTVDQVIECSTETEAIHIYKRLTSDGKKGYLFGFGVEYGNQLNTKLRYRTEFLNQIFEDDVNVLKYDIIDLPYPAPNSTPKNVE